MNKIIMIAVVIIALTAYAYAGANEEKVVDTTKETSKNVIKAPEKLKNNISITDKASEMKKYKVGYVDDTISIKKIEDGYSSLVDIYISEDTINNLKGYNGKEFATLHINDDGTSEYRIIKTSDVLTKDKKVKINTKMSELIIGGATGVHTIDYGATNLFNTSKDIGITNVTAMTINITNPPAYGNVIDYDPGTNDTMPISGLLSWWRMDEGSGSILHDSAGSKHMPLLGGYQWVSGFPNTFVNATRFPHYTSYAQNNSEYTTQIGKTADFTVCLWGNATDVANTTSSKKFFATGISTSDRFSLNIRGGYVITGIYDGTAYRAQKRYAIQDGDSFFAAATYDYKGSVPGTMNLYVNENDGETTTNTLHSDYGAIIFRPNSAYEDNVMVFTRALSQDEVYNVMKGFAGVRVISYPGGSITPILSNSQTIVTEDEVSSLLFQSNKRDTTYNTKVNYYFQQDYMYMTGTENESHRTINTVLTAENNVTSGTITYDLTNGEDYTNPTISSNHTGATVYIDGDNLIIEYGTLTEGDSKYYNVTLEVVPASFVSHTPESLSLEMNMNDDEYFNVTTNKTTDIEWYVDGNLTDIDANTSSGSYQFVAMDSGDHNVSAVIYNDSLLWDISVLEPIAGDIYSFFPSNNSSSLIIGQYEEFNCTSGQIFDHAWYVDGDIVQYNNSTTYSEFLFTTQDPNDYNITVHVNSSQQSWNYTFLPNTIINNGSSSNSWNEDGYGTFFVNLTMPDDIDWYVNGAIADSNESVNYATFVLSGRPGNYSVSALSTWDSRQWNITITEVPWNHWVSIGDNMSWEYKFVNDSQYADDLEVRR